MNVLPPFAFALAALWAWWRHERCVAAGAEPFRSAAALVATLGLLLMILSKKSFPFYALMFWPFLLHVLATRRRLDGVALAAWAWLGLTTTTQVHVLWLDEILTSGHLLQGPEGWVTYLIQLVTLASYGLLLVRVLPEGDTLDADAAANQSASRSV
jgi:hypothetical protein